VADQITFRNGTRSVRPIVRHRIMQTEMADAEIDVRFRSLADLEQLRNGVALRRYLILPESGRF